MPYQIMLRDTIFRELVASKPPSNDSGSMQRKSNTHNASFMAEESMIAMRYLSRNNADLPSTQPKTYNIEAMKIAESFINSSLLFKLRKFESTSDQTNAEGTPDSDDSKTITNEFRGVTIIFCKLEYDFDVRDSQIALSGFLNIMKLNNGCFQQFSST